SFSALGYDATKLLAQAARKAGASREAIQHYLEQVGRNPDHPAFEGATGTIRFDANGDPVDKSFAVGVIRGGKILLNHDF
ncbi:MAG TPA: hypothetical protein VFI96_01785, partial [Longimicrobiaceae bacterium]|nr:hypothetical protein [Longimicrobiaceae bacterium]